MLFTRYDNEFVILFQSYEYFCFLFVGSVVFIKTIKYLVKNNCKTLKREIENSLPDPVNSYFSFYSNNLLN